MIWVQNVEVEALAPPETCNRKFVQPLLRDFITVYQIPKSMTISDCEKFLRDIHESTELSQIALPTRRKISLGGGEAAFSQAICTWARKQPNPSVRTYIKDGDISFISPLLATLYGLIACFNTEIILGSKGEDISSIVRTKGLERVKEIQNMKANSFPKGNELQIVCVDHLSMGNPESLYAKGNFVEARLRDRAEFQYIARQIVKALVVEELSSELTPEVVSGLGGMLYEIFRNTEDHGLRGLDKSRLMHSVRGIHARVRTSDLESFLRFSSDYTPLKDYFSQFKVQDSNHTRSFFELSVFDSGVGFAPSWLKLPIESILPRAELSAIRSCFEPNQTSKTRSGYGIGLPKVLESLIQLSGFLRLRTGRFSVVFSFAGGGNKVATAFDELESNLAESILSPVEGALLTILFPLRRSSNRR